jgi:hypothetical protein
VHLHPLAEHGRARPQRDEHRGEAQHKQSEASTTRRHTWLSMPPWSVICSMVVPLM